MAGGTLVYRPFFGVRLGRGVDRGASGDSGAGMKSGLDAGGAVLGAVTGSRLRWRGKSGTVDRSGFPAETWTQNLWILDPEGILRAGRFCGSGIGLLRVGLQDLLNCRAISH